MGKFTFHKLEVPEILLIEPTVFGDERGYFMETYHKEEFAKEGLGVEFVQDNQSMSNRGVLRGLHFQKEHTQGKLVRVLSGRVFDVGVDVRPGSPWFGKWAGAELNDENRSQLYVPPGFAHGFLVLSDTAVFTYKCTDMYDPSSEGGVLWNDKELGIDWPDAGVPVQLSEKDGKLPGVSDQDFSFFERWK